jgi:hypothetical protein
MVEELESGKQEPKTPFHSDVCEPFVESDTFSAGVVQDLESVAIEDADNGAKKSAAITNSLLSQVIDRKARSNELRRLTKTRRVTTKSVD